eukprot:9331420-Pyramimonas_sp.AAC.1
MPVVSHGYGMGHFSAGMVARLVTLLVVSHALKDVALSTLAVENTVMISHNYQLTKRAFFPF